VSRGRQAFGSSALFGGASPLAATPNPSGSHADLAGTPLSEGVDVMSYGATIKGADPYGLNVIEPSVALVARFELGRRP
jgi:hypothetical protein